LTLDTSHAPRQHKPPKRARGQLRVRSLLDAAERVFASVGYESATMSAIAERAAAPIGSLYQFFPSKEAIAIALIDQYLEALAGEWARLGAGLRRGSIGRLCRGLTGSTRRFISTRPAYPALESIPARTDLQPKGRQTLLVQLQILLARVAPDSPIAERAPIAAVLLQLIKSEYALDNLVDAALAARAREEICFVMESYLTNRLMRPAS
jgi:AcrR family transcriptional regulator